MDVERDAESVAPHKRQQREANLVADLRAVEHAVECEGYPPGEDQDRCNDPYRSEGLAPGADEARQRKADHSGDSSAGISANLAKVAGYVRPFRQHGEKFRDVPSLACKVSFCVLVGEIADANDDRDRQDNDEQKPADPGNDG